jgi:hypothetical protein
MTVKIKSRCVVGYEYFGRPWCLHLQVEVTLLLGPFEKFVDCRQRAAVMQREAVTTVMPSCSGEGNVVVA